MKYFKEVNSPILLTKLIYIIIGIAMIIIPEFISNSICYIISILIIFFGLSCLIKYIQLKKHNIISNIMLVISIIALILGLVIFINPEFFISIVPFVIGIYIIIIGVSKYIEAIEIKKANYKHWYIVMFASILLLLLGIVIIFNPFKTLTLIITLVGIIFTINSLYDIYNIYSYQKNFNNLKKDIYTSLK